MRTAGGGTAPSVQLRCRGSLLAEGKDANIQEPVRKVPTHRLQSSSFLVMTYFLLRDYNIQPKKELLWSPWVPSTTAYIPCSYLEPMGVGPRKPWTKPRVRPAIHRRCHPPPCRRAGPSEASTGGGVQNDVTRHLGFYE